MTINDELRAMRERVETATEGPWSFIKDTRLDGMPVFRVGSDSTGEDIGAVPRYRSDDDGSDDATFIAHARTDLPRLLDAVERVMALVDRVTVRASESPARMFGGDPFPPILTAKDVYTAITEALDS